MSKKKPSTKKGKKELKVRRPKAQVLPGMEDSAIAPLERTAHAYAEVRDERMILNAQESKLKERLLRLMKDNNKEHYQHAGVSITVIHEEETVKVRIRKPDDGRGADTRSAMERADDKKTLDEIEGSQG